MTVPPLSTGPAPHVRRVITGREYRLRGWLFHSVTDQHLYILDDSTTQTRGGGAVPGASSVEEAIARVFAHTASDLEPAAPLTGVGEYFPRIYRPTSELDFAASIRAPAVTSVRAAVQVLKQLETCFDAIEPATRNLQTYGQVTRQVLTLACMDVEASWKAILRANGAGDGRATTNHYVRLHEPMHLSAWEVTLTHCPELLPFKPFETWTPASPTESLPWYAAYNAVKHDREEAFPRATLGAAINACAASIIMLAAQFGPDFLASLPIPGPYAPPQQPDWYLSGMTPTTQAVFGPYVVKCPDWPLAEDYVQPTLTPHATFAKRPRAWGSGVEAAEPPPWQPRSHPALFGILS